MNRYLFYSLLLLGLAFRLVMVGHYGLVNGGDVDVYLADEGVVGLMGKHILEGSDFPIFFYGQHYLGALEAYCAALGFALFGVSFLSLHIVTLFFSIAVGVAVYRFTYRFYSVAAARWATALVAVAPMYFLQWNLKARGGFVEHLFLVLVVMLLFWRFFLEHRRSWQAGLSLGLATGIALWVNQLVLAYIFVMGALLLTRLPDRRGWAAVCVGGLLGASLLIGYNVVYPLATFKSLARKAMVVNRVPVEERDEEWLARGLMKRVEAISQGLGKLGLVFGVPPSPEMERLGFTKQQRAGGALTGLRRALFFLPLLVFGWAFVAGRPRLGRAGWEPLGSDQLLALFLLVTFVVGYVSPRYMLAAYPLASIMAAVLVTRLSRAERGLMGAGICLVMMFNMVSWADAVTVPRDGSDQRGERLLSFLDEHHLHACYCAAPLYHLVFSSGESVILAPLQKDRYPTYDRLVDESASICYVFREDQQRKRQHVAFMRLLFKNEVQFKKGRAGIYNVLYDFSPREVLTADAMAGVKTQERVKLSLPGLPGSDRE